ncbi:hypothetical protein [Streptosporangium sp. NPDC003464]
MRFRVTGGALAVAAIALTVGCGDGQDSAGGDVRTGFPESPKESYAMVMEGLFSRKPQQVCELMSAEASAEFTREMRRWKDAWGDTCEQVVVSFADKRTAPPPKEWGITMYGEIEFPAEDVATLPACPQDASGNYLGNFAKASWKKYDSGWVITEFDISTGCGG